MPKSAPARHETSDPASLRVGTNLCRKPRSCRIQNIPLFGHLAGKDWRRFQELTTVRTYHRENILFYQGNRPLGLYFICSGRVKIAKEDRGGRNQIVRIVEAPNLLGDRSFFADKSYACTGEVMEESKICFLEARHFWEIFGQDHEILRFLIRDFAQKFGEAEEHMHCLAACAVKARIARYLLAARQKLSNTSSQKNEFILQETRIELAQIVGTSPEVISRSLAEFCSAGWIAVEDRRVCIKDERHLHEVACPHNSLD